MSFFYLIYILLFSFSWINSSFAEDKKIDKNSGIQGHFPSPEKEPLYVDLGNLEFRTQIKFKPESFYLKNSNLLNSLNRSDKIIVSRHTIDFNFDLLYGKKYYGYDVSEFFLTFRNKGVWGNPESIAQTSETNLKILEATFGEHKHFITRHIIWIREIWLKFCINNAFGLSFENNHYFTLGAFPFELGRGISLGNAFAVGPRILGFYSNNAVDQYAFGFKFAGDIFEEKLRYDFYGAILENRSDSMANTALKIRGQEFGRRRLQERGPGIVDFVVASRLRWYPIQDENSKVAFEPYLLFNNSPEQRIEIDASAGSKLATLGIAGECYFSDFEFGFDAAKNFGRQVVRGIDRNQVEFANRSGAVTLVNSRVHDTMPNGAKTIYVPNSPAQELVNTSAQDASQNGKSIGVADGVELFNDINRFRNPSSNRFKGWMAVADASYKLDCKGDWKIAATAGVASGDENPNQDLDNPNSSNVDGDFKGFVGLQEIYSGYRVRSVFLLAGVGKVPRPLSLPTSTDVLERLPSVISGFTNIAFVGSALHYHGNIRGRTVNVNPNALAYWQQKATKAFDRSTGMSFPDKFAKNYLGLELNVLFDAALLDSCKIYAVSSAFIPGGHYADIKGTPLTRDELKFIDNPDATGITNDLNPLLSDNIAFTINVGIEYRF